MSGHEACYISKLINAITDDDGDLARQFLNNKKHLKSALNLSPALIEEVPIPDDVKFECPIITSAYRPGDAWCLAAVYNARHVIRAMKEWNFPISQVNHRGNTFLHCIIALASMGDEEDEERAVSTVEFIKALISDEEYMDILRVENDDGLRPLELASHLGTFLMFQFLFETKGLYLSKIHSFGISSIQYYDITEYVTGKRYLKSPPHTMMLLDRSKMTGRAVQKIFLHDPMKAWFASISYSNMPYIITLAILKIAYIAGFFATLFLAKTQVIRSKSYQVDLNGNSTNSYENQSHGILNILLLMVLFYNVLYAIALIIGGAIYAAYRVYLYRSMTWINKTASGKKDVIIFSWTYFIAEACALIGILIISVDILHLQFSHQTDKIFSSDYINLTALIVVFACVWDILYFLQLIPGLSLYVIAIHRMLQDFTAFGTIFLLFFFCYVFGFYLLDNNAETFSISAYGTFQLMLNMINYSDGTATLKMLHVTFIFMIVYLLQNILIAIFASSFQNVKNDKQMLFTVQSLSVFLQVELVVTTLLGRLHNHRRKKHLIFEDGRVYITRVVTKPIHK